ncbi:MAG: nitrilase-related carbon-nitrogen hydrolase [Deltaproteobacteria bacterium]|nr:nitrilase-related carbon-nitrogen hydrolase [Deltaproteobacteria bacterium]
MRIAAAQMDIAWHDRTANHNHARPLAKEAKASGSEILIFPEMFSTGFSMDTAVTGEPKNGATPTFLRSLARDLRMVVVGGFAMADTGKKPMNVALTVDPWGKDLALYAKIHQIALLEENTYYEAGERAIPFALGPLKTACLICFDLRFPELFRALADHCGLILVIASWPAERQAHWDVLLRARAIENQCYVLGLNRVGEGGGLTFTGGSAIIDPAGEMIASGGENETLLIADIDPERVGAIRSAMPFLKQRKFHPFL